MSPGLKSMVTAFGPVLNTVMRPLPLIQYCHSSALGCQCSSRMPPGCTVTRAAAIVFETLKLLLSAIRTSPPLVWRVGFIAAREKGNGDGGEPPGPNTAGRSAPRHPGTSPRQMERDCSGVFPAGSTGEAEGLAQH